MAISFDELQLISGTPNTTSGIDVSELSPVSKKEPSLLESFKSGFGQSITGLGYKSITGDKYIQPVEPTKFSGKAASMIGSVLGDLPSYLVFGSGGAMTGPTAFVTSPALAMGGTELLRSHLISQLSGGEFMTPEEVAKAGAKGTAIGATIGPLGQISKVPGISKWVAKTATPLEIAGGATVASGLEGKPVTAEDVALFSVPVAAIKGTSAAIKAGKEGFRRRPVKEVPQEVKSDIIPDEVLTENISPANKTIANRRRRDIVKDIQTKQDEQVELAKVLKKEKEEVDSDNLIIETPEDKPISISQEQKDFIDNKVKELGSAEKVREVYKTDSPIDVYARERVNEVIDNKPFVQNLNKEKIPLSEEEIKQLEATDVYTPEEIENIKKMSPEEQRYNYNRMFEPEVKYTPEELEKAKAIVAKVEQMNEERISKKKNIKTLESKGDTLEDIFDLEESSLYRKASKARGETYQINPTDEDIARMDANENKIAEFKKSLGNKPIEEWTDSEADAYLALIDSINKDLDRFDVIEPATKLDTSKKEVDYNKILAEEGMPEDITFSENEMQKMNTFEKKQASIKPKTNKELSEEALNNVVSGLKGNINSNIIARNLIANAYRIMPRTIEEALYWDKLCTEVESKVEGLIEHKRSAFSRKAIADALSKGEINKEQAKYINAIFNTLKQQPTFGFEINSNMSADRSGVYNLARNLIEIEDPNALAHEIGHFAFFNILNASDRATYRKYIIDNFYKEGKIDWQKVRLETTNPLNAVRNPSEIFACKISDYTHDKVLSPAEMNLFTKVKSWFSQLKDRLIKLGGDNRFDNIENLFDKVLDKRKRRFWTEGESRPAFTEVVPNMDIAFNEKKIWSGSPLFIKNLANKVKMPSKITLENLGVSDISNRISLFKNLFNKAKMNDEGKNILAEVKGNDWGLATELKSRPIISVDSTTLKERMWRGIGPYISSPMIFTRGTRNERHVYNTNLAEMFISHMYDQHRTTIDNIYHNLKKEGGVKENVRKVIEGKIEGNEAEQKAAQQVRDWLDRMKARYKIFLINDYKNNLSKTEYNALLDIVTGSNIEKIKSKYPRLSTDTIEEIAKNYKEIDTWGIDNYLPNVEAGRFKILANAETIDGKPYKRLVAIGLSEKDAVRKATKYLENNPDVKDLYIDTDFKSFSDDKTSITSKQYYGMMNSLAKKMLESIDNIDKGIAREMAKKTLSRKFKIIPTDSYSPFLEKRLDILEGEEDIFPVLKSYAHSMEKKMALDPVIDMIRKDIPKMDKYEKAYILDYIEDVKGRYGAGDKFVDDIFRTYRGYSRLISRARTAEANLKLGYRPVAAAVNLVSGQMHAWVKRGTPIYIEGVKFLNTEEGKKFMREIEPFLGTSIIETGTDIHSKTPKWKPLGMFQMPEPLNREVSVAAAYKQALKEGMSDDAAREFAIRANWAEQFTYNMANLPKIMRSPTGKLLTQFKPYLVKEVEFMSTLSGKEWMRYLAMQLSLGGPRGYMMVLKSLPILAMFGFWQEITDNIEEWMNKEVPIASRGVAALPGLIKPEYASDISAAATFQFPSGTKDLLGPALSDLVKIYNDVLVPLSTQGPYAEDLKKTGDLAPIIRHWRSLMRYAFSEDDWLRDDKGNKLYKIEDNIPFIIQSLAGVESADINRIRTEERILSRRDERVGGIKTRLINMAMQCYLKGVPIPEDLRNDMRKNGVSVQSLKRRVQGSNLTPRQRAIINSEITRRRDAMEMFPEEKDFGSEE